MSISLCDAFGLILLQRSIVKRVLALLNMEVRELMMADIMTARRRPRRPENNNIGLFSIDRTFYIIKSDN